MTIPQAMDEIRGLCFEQIELTSLGLSLDDLKGHHWNWRGVYDYSIAYLKNHPRHLSIQQAMDNIRGLECIEISAICLGLNREDLQGHDWCEVGRASIDYLQAAPKSIVIQWAMNCIRGLNQQAINQLEDRQGRGQSRYGLTAMQVFIKGFTQNQYNAIRRGAAFKDAMPEAYQAIMREENKQSAYIQGAVYACQMI